ncbi:hypothetical protein D3C84_235660 [compost metagenome]
MASDFQLRPPDGGAGVRADCRGGPGRWRLVWPESEDRRPRSGRARTAPGLALQPGQRLRHPQLLDQFRCVGGDGQDRFGRLFDLPDPVGHGRADVDDGKHRGRAVGHLHGHGVASGDQGHERGQPEMGNPVAQPGRAEQLDCACRRSVQRRLFGGAGAGVPQRPQGGNPGTGGRGGRRVRQGNQQGRPGVHPGGR